MLLDGPREPKFVYSLLEPVFQELERLFQDGIEVFDSLTSSVVRIRAGIVGTVNDLPASAKLGEFETKNLHSPNEFF